MIIPVDLRKSGPLIHADFVTQIKRAKSKRSGALPCSTLYAQGNQRKSALKSAYPKDQRAIGEEVTRGEMQ